MRNFLLILSSIFTMTIATNAQNQSKILVTYFSASGTTESVAQKIANVTGADLYEIVPADPYTSADLNWNNKQSRSSVEMNDETSRPPLKSKNENIANYDVIFIGFPIWWNLPPRIINTFIESHNLEGKNLIPFATSGGSNISNSVKYLKKTYPTLNWKDGRLLNHADESSLRSWTSKIEY